MTTGEIKFVRFCGYSLSIGISVLWGLFLEAGFYRLAGYVFVLLVLSIIIPLPKVKP